MFRQIKTKCIKSCQSVSDSPNTALTPAARTHHLSWGLFYPFHKTLLTLVFTLKVWSHILMNLSPFLGLYPSNESTLYYEVHSMVIQSYQSVRQYAHDTH